MTWRYFAQRLTRHDGPGEILDSELPLAEVSLTETLSGPSAGSAMIPVEFARLKGPDGRPILQEWGTAIYAETDGQIRHAGILVSSDFQDQQWQLEWLGWSGYAKDLPYLDAMYHVEADPLDIVRHIWEHIQTRHSNLGLILDATTSPVRIGTELEQVEFDTQSGPVSFEAGPHKLNWYQTHDLQQEVDKLAKETPFDYTEETAWVDGQIERRLRLHYPRKGVRRSNRFMLGENIFTPPSVTHAENEFANGVLALGAGEGRDMVRSPIIESPDDNRLFRVAVVVDKDLRSIREATDLARRELVARLNQDAISDVVVKDHPHAPLAGIHVGDEIRIQSPAGWAEIDLWVRVLSKTIQPDSSEMASLSVVRTDRLE